MRRTLRLTLAYDGTGYAGWQRQHNALAVQAVLEDALATIVGFRIPINAAGRTDAGVHAAGQVASVVLAHPIACDALVSALNNRLPREIRVRLVEEMFDGFDARVHAVSKTYRYAIWNGEAVSPFLRHVVWQVPQPLDVDRMMAAASTLVGEHDFAGFQAAGGDVKTTRRRLLTSEIVRVNLHTEEPVVVPSKAGAGEAEHPLIRYEVTGTGFLRHMVRTIVGTLVEIGRGRLPVEVIAAILESADRRQAGMTAPPLGLMLWKVNY